MTDTNLTTLRKLIGGFDRAMLVTRREGELRSRPMHIGDTTADGRIRFITRDDSAKLGELDDDDRVNVSMQDDMKFLSISGHARASKDPELIDAAWDSRQSDWFVEGRDDPRVIALEVVPTHAEFWDRSGDDVLTVALDKLRSALSDDPAVNNDVEHADIDFDDKPA